MSSSSLKNSLPVHIQAWPSNVEGKHVYTHTLTQQREKCLQRWLMKKLNTIIFKYFYFQLAV
jgi:hypothetical protein